MEEPTEIVGYDVEVVDDVWHARRRAEITPEQAAHGILEVITAESFDELKSEAIAQRIRASWYP